MNEDKNLAVSTLASLGAICGVAGLIVMIIGFNSSEKIEYVDVPYVNGGKVAAGSALLGFALMIWVLLLLFWAWRHERRNVPAATPPAPVVMVAPTNTASAAAARQVGQNRAQREASAQKLRWSDDA